MLVVGLGIYVAFTFLDHTEYPAQASLFFKMRVVACLMSLMVSFPVFFRSIQRYTIWAIDFMAVFLVGTISGMIYLSDGSSSQYYAGINLVLLGMAVVNSFYVWHSLGVCLMTMSLYSLAAFTSASPWNVQNFFAAICFMSSTAMCLVLLTKFYSDKDRKAFLQNEKLKEDEKKLEVLYGMAEEKSKIDDLTKIYNRGYFFEILAAKINACKNAGSFFYLIIFDIDRFKEINDTYGHVFGDQVIAAVAKTAQNVMRLNSYIGRYGGDEFMLIIDKATREEFLFRLQRIREAICSLELFSDGKPVSVSASFGAARWTPDMTEKKLIELADGALLEVKRIQRGEIKLANDSSL